MNNSVREKIGEAVLSNEEVIMKLLTLILENDWKVDYIVDYNWKFNGYSRPVVFSVKDNEKDYCRLIISNELIGELKSKLRKMKCESL